MKLVSAQVNKFKSIEDSGTVPIDEDVTVLVGQNESGKTAFLQALYKSRPIDSSVKYRLESDYPRKDLIPYRKKHAESPAEVVRLKFVLDDDDMQEVNENIEFEFAAPLTFAQVYRYDNKSYIVFVIPEEAAYVEHVVRDHPMSQATMDQCLSCKTVKGLIAKLGEMDLTSQEKSFLDWLNGQFDTNSGWLSLLAHRIWNQVIKSRVPKFVYFDDYYLLPGKISIPDLERRQENETLEQSDQVALALLRLADVSLDDLNDAAGYESIKAQLEAISNTITDSLFEFWKQNTELDVEFDIRADPADSPPFNEGLNIYIRIENKKHRVSVPFSQRSKGFIWFFSFLTWFDSIKQEFEGQDLILLLDEPGLSLHALAQGDFLRYIDHLSDNHQILYTTHSPFMVRSQRLDQARTVQDLPDVGTKVSEQLSNSDPDTLFPLQAALGYTIAQNLFIGNRNLLVEGPADLLYLQYFSEELESRGRTGLSGDVTIVPVGGLTNLSTFISLIGANDLELVVLSDYSGSSEQKLDHMVQEKLIEKKRVLNYALYRGDAKMPATDIEDLFTPATYLKVFNKAFQDKLPSPLKVGDLPQRERMVVRIGGALDAMGVKLKGKGGYNHYTPANYLVGHPLPPSGLDSSTLDRFEELFKAVNVLFLD